MTQPWPYHVQLPPPRRRVPVWVIVLLSVFSGLCLLIAALVGTAALGGAFDRPTDGRIAQVCQQVLEEARPGNTSATYDPSSVVITETGADTYVVNGRVRLTSWPTGSTATASYQCDVTHDWGGDTLTVTNRKISL